MILIVAHQALVVHHLVHHQALAVRHLAHHQALVVRLALALAHPLIVELITPLK